MQSNKVSIWELDVLIGSPKRLSVDQNAFHFSQITA